MKRIIIILCIYLSGCFIAYIFGRSILRKELGRYTTGDRSVVLIFSTFSWLTVAAFTLDYGIKYIGDSDKPAKW